MKLSKLFCYYRIKGFFWFRVFGYGIKGKNLKIHYPMFSERYGFTSHYVVFGWSFGVLR